MKVIGHQAKGQHLPTALPARLGQCADGLLPVLIILKNRLPSAPSIHHLINCTRILYSELARHAAKRANAALIYQYQELNRL
jgi:hypothetical protein